MKCGHQFFSKRKAWECSGNLYPNGRKSNATYGGEKTKLCFAVFAVPKYVSSTTSDSPLAMPTVIRPSYPWGETLAACHPPAQGKCLLLLPAGAVTHREFRKEFSPRYLWNPWRLTPVAPSRLAGCWPNFRGPWGRKPSVPRLSVGPTFYFQLSDSTCPPKS